jgi:transcriptional regulator with XRE-family HTH domain
VAGALTFSSPQLVAVVRGDDIEVGLSQEAVALEAEMEPSWMSHIESGRRNPSWSTVERIATALGVHVSDIAVRAELLAARASKNG